MTEYGIKEVLNNSKFSNFKFTFFLLLEQSYFLEEILLSEFLRMNKCNEEFHIGLSKFLYDSRKFFFYSSVEGLYDSYS